MRPWVLAAALLAAVPVAAQEEPGYRRTVVPGRPLCLLWPGRDYVYHLDAAGNEATPGASEVAAIEASFDSWRRVAGACSDYRFLRGEDWSLPVAVGYDQEHPFDNYNVVTFRQQSCQDVVPAEDPCWEAESCGNAYRCWEHGSATIGLTTSTFSFRDGRVLDSDIELNAAPAGGGFFFTTVDSPVCEGAPSADCVATDVQNTMTHEIGHVVGLDHVALAAATMAASASPGELQKRTVDPGTAEGFCSIYPRHLPPNQCLVRQGRGLTLEAEARGTGCAAAPGPLALGAWLAALVLARARGRAGAPRGAR